jgi:hypothetical protein
MRPDWREIAKRNEAELGEPREEADLKTVADMKRRFEEARPVPHQEQAVVKTFPTTSPSAGRSPRKKGKWRMVSKEVEDEN